jgi:hypothetical protein
LKGGGSRSKDESNTDERKFKKVAFWLEAYFETSIIKPSFVSEAKALKENGIGSE